VGHEHIYAHIIKSAISPAALPVQRAVYCTFVLYLYTAQYYTFKQYCAKYEYQLLKYSIRIL
jgi:hypothetical protein